MKSKQILIGLVCMVFLWTNIASASLLNGIVAYWSFDSDFTADNGGAAFDFTAVNGATAGVSDGKFGGASSFTRSIGQYAYTAESVLTQGIDFSYSVWYKCTTANLPTYSTYQILQTAVSTTIPVTGDTGYSVNVALRDQNKVEQLYTGTRYADGSNGNYFVTQGAGSTDWHNLVVTRDTGGGVGGRNRMSIYVDGVLVHTADYWGSVAAVESLVIGGQAAGLNTFDGLVDDLAFWNRVITSDEIAQVQTSAIPEPTTLGLLVLGGMALLRRRNH